MSNGAAGALCLQKRWAKHFMEREHFGRATGMTVGMVDGWFINLPIAIQRFKPKQS